MKKQKILLINPPIRLSSPPTVFPSGLGYIAAALLKEGYEVRALDINGYRYDQETVRKKLKEYLVDGSFDIAGIGCLITCYDYVKWLINAIREINPQTKIIVGGGLGSSIPEITLNKLKADIVVKGEGEITIIDLLKTLEKKGDISRVRGIVFKKGDKIIRTLPRERIKDLDTLPLPAWHLFPMSIYLKNMFRIEGLENLKGNSMNVFAGRGCPYQCTFCYETFEHKAATRTPKSVVEEVKILQKKYDIKVMCFPDDLFSIDKKWVMEFCDLLMKEKIKLTWICNIRVNTMDEDMLRKMKTAGCILLDIGIESGSQKMLNIMKKGATVEQAAKALKTGRKLGFILNCNVMMGFPEETEETLNDTIDFCIKNSIHLTSIFFVTPYPGTAIYEQAKSMGLIKDEEEFISRLGNATEFTINMTKWSDDDLFRLRERVISSVHWGYFKRNKLKYVQWMRKKFMWYGRYIKVNGLKKFVDAKINGVKRMINREPARV